MASFKVEGPELKKLVKVARKQPVAFGFNPGAKEEEHYFGLDRKKPSKVVGKEAKDEGPGAKFAFGEMTVLGKEIHLKCERELPGMAKKLKKWLKKQKVALNVVILDASGNLLEQDIEDNLPDDPELELDDAAPEGGSAPEAPAPAPAPEETTSEDTATSASDAEALTRRLKEISARIKGLPEDRAAQIAAAFKSVVKLAQSGDLSAAAAGADKLEAALAKLSPSPKGDDSAPAPDNPQVAKLLKAVETLRAQAAPIADPQRQSQVADLLKEAEANAGGGQAEAALGLLKQAQEAIKAALAAPKDETSSDPNAAKWAAQFPKLEEAVKDARALDGKINPDHPDLVELSRLWQWATDNANDDPPNYTKALETVPALVAQIKKLRAAKAAGDPALNVATDVKPFAEAQLKWRAARGTMKSELQKLQAEIVKVCADDPELEGVAAEVGSLSDNLIGLDARLEDALIAIVNAAPGTTREEAKTSAKALLAEYRRELDADFFQVVDGGNGFVSVAVAQTARQALDDIARTLG